MRQWLARTCCLLAFAVSATCNASGPNFSGLWWTGPGGVDPGSSVAIDHQSNVIFAVWMTYDKGGEPTWTFLPRAEQAAPSLEIDEFGFRYVDPKEGTFAGPRYQPYPLYNSTSHRIRTLELLELGQAGFDFERSWERVFWWKEGAGAVTEKSQAIVPYIFGKGPAECVDGGFLRSEPNFQGLWWSSEPGWGIYLAHQGTRLFGAWFTYSFSYPTWRSLSLEQIDGNRYEGTIYSHRRMAATPPETGLPTVQTRAEGFVTITFDGLEKARLVLDISMDEPTRKDMERFRFGTPPTICRSPLDVAPGRASQMR